MDFLFTKKQIDVFTRFEEWILNHHHVIYGDDCDETEKYWCDRYAIKRQILNGLVEDIFSESSDDLLKIFQANINLELVRRSQKRKS
jgi:hypothetical protein